MSRRPILEENGTDNKALNIRSNTSTSNASIFVKSATSNTPPSNTISLYSKTGEVNLYTKDEDGNELKISTLPTNSQANTTVWSQDLFQLNSGGAGESILIKDSAGLGSRSIPANTIIEGTKYHLDAECTYEVSTASTIKLDMYLGEVLVGSCITTSLALQLNQGLTVSVNVAFSPGVPGLFQCDITGSVMAQQNPNPTVASFIGAPAVITNIDPTVAQSIDCRITFSGSAQSVTRSASLKRVY